MQQQLRNLLFWVGVIITLVATTIFYQPAAAKTGSLLVVINPKLQPVEQLLKQIPVFKF